METDSLGGSRYFVTFIDGKSKYVHVYFMSHKSEVTELFKKICNMAESQTERRIKFLRSDNGGEYRSKEMEKFQSERGILWQTTIPYTPEQTGVAERVNRTILEIAKSMLSFEKLDKSFWAEAVRTAVYIRNRILPSNDSVTPYEKWFGTKPDVSNLRIFGCRAMVHVPKEKRKKLDAKSKNCLLVIPITRKYTNLTTVSLGAWLLVEMSISGRVSYLKIVSLSLNCQEKKSFLASRNILRQKLYKMKKLPRQYQTIAMSHLSQLLVQILQIIDTLYNVSSSLQIE